MQPRKVARWRRRPRGWLLDRRLFLPQAEQENNRRAHGHAERQEVNPAHERDGEFLPLTEHIRSHEPAEIADGVDETNPPPHVGGYGASILICWSGAL